MHTACIWLPRTEHTFESKPKISIHECVNEEIDRRMADDNATADRQVHVWNMDGVLEQGDDDERTPADEEETEDHW